MSKKVSLILACTADGGIGYENDIPWYIPEDLKKFKKITSTCNDPTKINAVIMGRHTWESLKKPLSGRLNIIVTSNLYYKPHNCDDSVVVLHNIIAALVFCERHYIENVFIIGGAQLYNIFLEKQTYRKMVQKIYMSVLFYDETIQVDKFIMMPKIFEHFDLIKDQAYQQESDNRLFASFICIPKKAPTLKHMT